MKKYFFKNLIVLLLLTILIFIFTYSKSIKESIIFAIELWKNNLVTTIFPFLLISNLLIKYNFVEIISKYFGKIISRTYNLPINASFAVIMSLFTGFPTGSKYIKDLLKDKKIGIDDANSLITFTSFSNPLFVISGIGENLLKSKQAGIKILIVHIITGLLIGLFFKNKKVKKNYQTNIIVNNKSFIENLKESINDSFIILVNMLGIIIFFLILSTIISIIFKDNIIVLLLKGLLEITTGIAAISKARISFKLKQALVGLILSFNGLCIHFQTKSIISDTEIKYQRYLISRIIHSLLCFIILYII